MRYLLDTHVVLWLANDPDKLNAIVKSILENSELKIYFSAVNFWEIAIKNQLDRSHFSVDIDKLYQQLLKHDFTELPIRSKHTFALYNLAQHHKDPFDRLLIAQSISEGLALITRDTAILKYNEATLIRA